MSYQDGEGGIEGAGEMEMDSGRAARWQRAREERKITAGIGKQKPEKIYPIDNRRKWLLNNSPTDSALRR